MWGCHCCRNEGTFAFWGVCVCNLHVKLADVYGRTFMVFMAREHVWLIGFVESWGPFVERSMIPGRSLLLRFSVSCIVVAVLGYGMMSMYWCCRCRLNRFLLDLCRIFATTSPFTIMCRILGIEEILGAITCGHGRVK